MLLYLFRIVLLLSVFIELLWFRFEMLEEKLINSLLLIVLS